MNLGMTDGLAYSVLLRKCLTSHFPTALAKDEKQGKQTPLRRWLYTWDSDDVVRGILFRMPWCRRANKKLCCRALVVSILYPLAMIE